MKMRLAEQAMVVLDEALSRAVECNAHYRDEIAGLKKALAEIESSLQVSRNAVDQEMRRANSAESHTRDAWNERDRARRQLETVTRERDRARKEWDAWMKLAVGNGVSLGPEHMPKVEGVEEQPEIAEKE